MRISLASLFAAALLGAPSVFAQEPEPLPEEPAASTEMPEETDATSLIPDGTDTAKPATDSEYLVEVPPFEEIPTPEPEEAVIQENVEGKAQARRIQFFETRVKASADPAVQAEWARAQVVPTFPEQREAMVNYYKLLYARMEKLSPELKDMLAAKLNVELQRLKQTSIKPSVWPVPPPYIPDPLVLVPSGE